MHSCFPIYILFTDSNEGEKDQQHVFLSCVSFPFLGWGTESGAVSICRVYRTCTSNRISVGLSKCVVYSQWLQLKNLKKEVKKKKKRKNSFLQQVPSLTGAAALRNDNLFFPLCLRQSKQRGLGKVNLRC